MPIGDGIFPSAQSDADFLGEHPFDNAGRSATSAGDVNNDGFDDILIRSMSNSEGGEESWANIPDPWSA